MNLVIVADTIVILAVCQCLLAYQPMGRSRSGGQSQAGMNWNMDSSRGQRTAGNVKTDNVGPTTVELRMPGIRAIQEDEYICNSWKIPSGNNYITGFEALASASVAHHIILYGCRIPANFKVWRRCYSPCRMSSDNNILFAWARNAPPTKVPPDVGFELGGDSSVEYLVMQIHYKQPFTASQPDDFSGLQLTVNQQRPRYIAGVLIMIVNYLIIPAHAKKVHGDIVCKFNEAAQLHPFGFRVHAHELGRVVSGYAVLNGTSWNLLGKANPQWPQAFYPVQNNVTIGKGDSLAARCTYNASTKPVNTKIGATHNDEMCNFYIMYYTDASTGGQSFYSCSGVDQPILQQSMPPDSDTELPPNPDLEDHAEHGVSTHRHQISDNLSAIDGDGVHAGVRDNDVNVRARNGYVSGGGYNVRSRGDGVSNSGPGAGRYVNDYSIYPRSNSHSNVERPMEYEYSNDPEQDDSWSLPAGTSRDYVNELILQRSRNRHPAFPEDDGGYSPELDSQGMEAGSDLLADGNGPAVTDQSDVAGSTLVPRTVTANQDWIEQMKANKLVLGQVTGVATDSAGNFHLFHRASRRWTASSFDLSHRFISAADGPIADKVLVKLDGQTGQVLLQWGSNMFYLPHGLDIDLHTNNIWVTDVALHQVMRFKSAAADAVPDLVLGTKFEPGSDNRHFCKPAAVAVLSTGHFFVADGYCNSRVIEFTSDGTFIRQWGKHSRTVLDDGFPAVSTFSIVHSVTVIENQNLVCVADRENNRIQCFDLEGRFVRQIHTPRLIGRVFAVTYSALTGLLYAINGPDAYGRNVDVRGYTIDPTTGIVIDIWQPKDFTFQEPHDIAVSADGTSVFVCETNPSNVWKLSLNFSQGVTHSSTTTVSHSSPAAAAAAATGGGGGVSTTVIDLHQPLKQNLADVDTLTANTRQQTIGGDFGPSLFIGSLLFIPVTIIVCVTAFIRLRRSGRLRRLFRQSAHIRRNVERVHTKDIDRDELEHLQSNNVHSDSDVEEYSSGAVHQKA